jgi:hypothetical protein
VNATFATIYAVLAITAITVELIGVRRKGKDGDTITESWHWIERHMPSPARWLYRVFTAGFLLWVILHFLVNIG